MNRFSKSAKVNVRFLVVLAVVLVLIGAVGYAGLKVRKHFVTARALREGLAAYQKGDWQEARKNLGIYLSKQPDNKDILEKYAVAQLSVEPVDPTSIGQAINAYRRLLRLEPGRETVYSELARLYEGVGDFTELAYIAGKRLEMKPDDLQAKIWLAKAMMGQNKGEEAKPTLMSVVAVLDKGGPKQEAYVEACEILSHLTTLEQKNDSWAKSLEWLNKAVAYNPEWGEALVDRARFYRLTNEGGLSAGERIKRAKADLEKADGLTIEDPRLKLTMSMEWMELGDYERSAAELAAVDKIASAEVKKYFLDPADWTVAKFSQASELAIRTGELKNGMEMAREVLAGLTGRYQRLHALPAAILLYSYGEKPAEARKCLDEYLDIMNRLESNPEPAVKVAYLQALVAETESKPYKAIEILEPVAATNSSNSILLRLLAHAYSETDQPRRAVRVIDQYLRYQPGDRQMKMQLMGEYLKLKEFDKAVAVAKQTDAGDSVEMMIRLLGLELGSVSGGEKTASREKRLATIDKELNELQAKHQDKVEIRLLQATLASQMGKMDEAEAILKEAVKSCSDPWSAELQLARLYAGNKRMAEGIAVLQNAVKQEGKRSAVWEALAEFQMLGQQTADARKTLETGIGTVSDTQEKRQLQLKLAVLEIMQNQRAKGIADLKVLAEEDAQNVKARTLLLDMPEIRKDKATAEKLVSELKGIEGESGLMWRVEQATLWMQSDGWRTKQQEIATLLQRCIDGDPGWSAPVLLMGQLYERQGNIKMAESLYRKGLYENSSGLEVADRLVDLLERQKRYPDAMKVLEQVNVKGRAMAERKAAAAIKAGDIAQAIEQLKLKIASDPRDVNSRVLLARLYYSETKDAAGAMTYLAEAEKLSNESLTVKAAKVAILQAERRDDEAKKILDEEVTRHKSFQAYLMRAEYFLSIGKPDFAENDYRAMLGLSQKGEGYDVLGNYYFNAKKYGDAVRTLEAGVKAFPENLALQRGLMKSLLLRNDEGDRARAEGMLKELQTKLPDDSDLMWVQAVLLFKKGDDASMREGRELLEKVVALNPNAVDAYLGLVSLAVQENKIDRAKDLVVQALGANPSDTRLLLARAGIERRLGNLNQTLETARLVLRNDPKNAEARNLFINAAITAKDDDALKESCSLVAKGLKASPDDEDLHLLEAMVLDAMGKRSEAIAALKAYEQSAAGNKSVQGALSLAQLYRMNQDSADAEKWLKQAASLAPENGGVLSERLLDLAAKGQYAEIHAMLEKYQQQPNAEVGVLLTGASALLSSGNADYMRSAAAIFEKALSGMSPSPQALLVKKNLAQVKYMLGDVETAEKLYREVLASNGNNVDAMNDLAWLLAESKHRYEEALPLAEKGLTLSPNDTHLLDTHATICLYLPGRLQDARKDFEKCVSLETAGSSRQAKAYYKLGRVWLKLGSQAKAKSCFESAIKIDAKIKTFTDKERQEMDELTAKNG